MTAIVDDPVKDTYYCQAGDHLVDSVVWLEQVTMGCLPCMKKMRETLTQGTEIKMRLWSVGPDGYKQVAEPSAPVAQARKTSKAKAAAVRNTDIWMCNECGDTHDELGEGFYNTVSGYVCKHCAGTQKLGRSSETVLQRERRLDRQRRQEIKERAKKRARAADVGGPPRIESRSPFDAVLNSWLGSRAAEYQETIDEVADKLQAIQSVPPAMTAPTEYAINKGNDTVSCDTCGKRVKPVAAWNPNIDLARCSACWESQGAKRLGSGKMLIKGGLIPDWRLRDLAQIGGLQIVYGIDQIPLMGVDGQFFYVIESDELLRWVDVNSKWVTVPLPAPSAPRLALSGVDSWDN